MKVAFWSGTKKSGVTENLAAISTFCAIRYGQNVFLGSNYFGSKRLEDYFFKNPMRSGKERMVQSFSYGEPEYFRKLWEEKRHNKRGSITMEGIHLLGPPDILDRLMFYQRVHEETLYFMDISSGMNASSRAVLEEADIAAVFLPQDTAEIRKFFNSYSSIIPKSVFFISNYRKNTNCEPEQLSRIYGICDERIGVIPHCEAYLQACEEGEVESFIRKNLDCEEENEMFRFMQSIERAAGLILGCRKGGNACREEYGLPE